MAGNSMEVQKNISEHPVLDEYRSVRDHLHQRLCQEVAELESRIAALRASESRHSDAIIRTYERMITQKRAFMAQWGMSTPCVPCERESSAV